ncbi:MAG: hypothetical protein SGBAC_012708 [Bacillariaceae sp.]
MYAIYHQIDRQKKEQEEKENEQNDNEQIVIMEELKQLEAKYNAMIRRDSFSTITTQDTGIIIEALPDRKQLMPITWGTNRNGKLPIEISVPEMRKGENLLDDHDEVDIQAFSRPEPEDDALDILQNSLFVDDDEELALIFHDSQEDEMNVQRTVGNHRVPLQVSLAPSSESSESLYIDDDGELANIYDDNQEDEMKVQSTMGNPCAPLEASPPSSSASSDALYVDDDDELALIYDSDQEDEMNAKRTMGNPRAPLETSLAPSLKSSESSFAGEVEELSLLFDDDYNREDEMKVQRSSSESSESSFYSETTSCDSKEDILRFECEGFTRFEI